jgi:hypothetical protein
VSPSGQELVNTLWAFAALGHAPSLPWQHACVAALRAACAQACGLAAPLDADQVGALLEEGALLQVVTGAVAEQAAADELGGGVADGGAGDGGLECALSLAFELPLGAA